MLGAASPNVFSDLASGWRSQGDRNEQALEGLYQGDWIDQTVAGAFHIPMQFAAGLEGAAGFALGLASDGEYRSQLKTSIGNKAKEVGGALVDGNWDYFAKGFEQRIDNTAAYFDNRGANFILGDIATTGLEFLSGAGLVSKSAKLDVSDANWDDLPSTFDRDGSINAIVDKIGSDVKGHPLRQNYEDKVVDV
ncbi:MAG: hypothetical protein RPS99_00010 [Gammaproteobacteria bacterium]